MSSVPLTSESAEMEGQTGNAQVEQEEDEEDTSTKQRMMTNGIGAILAMFGSSQNKAPKDSAPKPDVSSQEENAPDVNDDEAASTTEKNSEDGELHETNSDRTESDDSKQGTKEEKNNDWLEEKSKELAEYYGPYIKVAYTCQNVIGYLCEVCLSEMTGYQSLELHITGSKHLKKVAIFEKNKGVIGSRLDPGIGDLKASESTHRDRGKRDRNRDKGREPSRDYNRSKRSSRERGRHRDRSRDRDRSRSRDRARRRRGRSRSRSRDRSLSQDRSRRKRDGSRSRDRLGGWSRDRNRGWSRDRSRSRERTGGWSDVRSWSRDGTRYRSMSRERDREERSEDRDLLEGLDAAMDMYYEVDRREQRQRRSESFDSPYERSEDMYPGTSRDHQSTYNSYAESWGQMVGQTSQKSSLETAYPSQNTSNLRTEAAYPGLSTSSQRNVIYPGLSASSQRTGTAYPGLSASSQRTETAYPGQSASSQRTVTAYPFLSTSSVKTEAAYPSQSTSSLRTQVGYPSQSSSSHRAETTYPYQNNSSLPGPVRSLIMNLASCSMKSKEDVELGLKIIEKFMAPLKTYSCRMKDFKAADLIAATEVNLKSLKEHIKPETKMVEQTMTDYLAKSSSTSQISSGIDYTGLENFLRNMKR